MIHAISTKTLPDVDKLPIPYRTPAQADLDRRMLPLAMMAEFRRLRQSTCSILRGLPVRVNRRLELASRLGLAADSLECRTV